MSLLKWNGIENAFVGIIPPQPEQCCATASELDGLTDWLLRRSEDVLPNDDSLVSDGYGASSGERRRIRSAAC